MKPPPILDAITDVVLAYRPTSKKRKKRYTEVVQAGVRHMTDNELKKYVDDAVEKAMKSSSPQTAMGIPLAPGLFERLEKIELFLVAAIRSLQGHLPARDLRSILQTYKRLRNEKQRGAYAAIAELDDLLEQDGK